MFTNLHVYVYIETYVFMKMYGYLEGFFNACPLEVILFSLRLTCQQSALASSFLDHIIPAKM